jgi:hypothetical protein
MAINRSLINRIERVIEAAEAVLGRADQPLTLREIVLDGDDEREVKARALAAHIAAHPEDSGRPVAWEIFRIVFVSPAPIVFVSPAPEPPRDYTASYVVADGKLTLTDSKGKPIEIAGKCFVRTLAPGDDESAVADALAREAFAAV